jgi:hypothetical protein
MYFDVAFALMTIGAFVTGYKNGLFTTILRGAFFIAGAIAGMYFVVEYNKSGWLIAAIVGGAYVAAWVGTQVAKTIKFAILRGPLGWLDSLLGAVFEVAKYVVLFYVIGTIILWSPWSAGQSDLSKSKAYLKMNEHAPTLLVEIRHQVEKRIQ